MGPMIEWVHFFYACGFELSISQTSVYMEYSIGKAYEKPKENKHTLMVAK